MRTINRRLSTLMLIALLVTTFIVPTFGAFTLHDAGAFLFKDCKATWAKYYITTYDDITDAPTDAVIISSFDTSGNEVRQCTNCKKYHYLNSTTTPTIFATKAEEAYKSSEVATEVTQMQTNMGLEANIEAAMDALSGFMPTINVILGGVVVMITLGLAVFTSFDVAYIVFPVFRNHCEETKATGQGPMAGGKTPNGTTKLRFVSDEAQYAVEQCNISQGKSPLTAYLAKRVWAYIAVSIILFILLTGNINIITNIALKIVGYIMAVLATLG